MAREKLDRIEAALRAGRQPDRYAYAAHPIRELQIERFGDAGEPFAVVTRNGYGALVLNTRRVAFVDIDVKPAKASGFFAQLFGRVGSIADAKAEARERVEKLVGRKGSPSLRIYETNAGLRLLLTDRLHEPDSSETQAMLRSFGADPLYARLCKGQRCFRARLTAKPWRIDLDNPPLRFPGTDPPRHYLDWCARYEREASAFPTCRHLTSLGASSQDEHIRRVIEIHDAQSGAARSGDLR